MGSLGQLGSTSDQFSAVEKMSANCSKDASSRKSFSWLTTTARASVPTRNSIGSRPIAWQLSTSLSLIARLALETSVSPASQKREKPAPLPMLSMVTLPPKPSSWNRSAIRSARGKTVELPAETIVPSTASGSTGGRATTSTVSTTVVGSEGTSTTRVASTTRVTSTWFVSVTTRVTSVVSVGPQATNKSIASSASTKTFDRMYSPPTCHQF